MLTLILWSDVKYYRYTEQVAVVITVYFYNQYIAYTIVISDWLPIILSVVLVILFCLFMRMYEQYSAFRQIIIAFFQDH
jgi:hypothetical protein